MSIGTKTVCHMAFITRDIQKFTGSWAKFLGIEQPAVWAIPSKDIAPTATFGKPENYKDCLISVLEFDNIKLEVVQPGEEPNPWKLYLEKYGEGFQHISFVVPDPDEAEATLKELGVDSGYHIGCYPGSTYSFYDTKDVLGMEINIKYDGDNKKQRDELLKQYEERK